MVRWLRNETATRVWEPEHGPWSYTASDYWCNEAQLRFEDSDDYDELQRWVEREGLGELLDADDEAAEGKYVEKYGELEGKYYPQPNTPDWYRCYGACHWLCLFECAVGRLVLPELAWRVFSGSAHSTAIGLDSVRGVIFDFLWGRDHTPTEILRACSFHGRRGRTLEEELRWCERVLVAA